jgi:hypothetical protein
VLKVNKNKPFIEQPCSGLIIDMPQLCHKGKRIAE